MKTHTKIFIALFVLFGPTAIMYLTIAFSNLTFDENTNDQYSTISWHSLMFAVQVRKISIPHMMVNAYHSYEEYQQRQFILDGYKSLSTK